MNKTNIEWVGPDGYSFNPIVGCSAACPYCYARLAAKRMKCPDCQSYRPHFHPERLAQLGQGKPGRVFMGSMGDMFAPKVDPDWWRQILWTHEASGFRHKLMVLTKRPDRIIPVINRVPLRGHLILDKLWFGATVTCQADEWRIKALLEVPAAGHFVSYEPALGPVETYDWFYCPPCDYPANHICGCPTINWLVIGGLSGPWLPDGWTNPKMFHLKEATWANQIIAQAKAAGVPIFVKTKPVKLPGVEVIQEWPADLRPA